jgi:hypothetical protein
MDKVNLGHSDYPRDRYMTQANQNSPLTFYIQVLKVTLQVHGLCLYKSTKHRSKLF